MTRRKVQNALDCLSSGAAAEVSDALRGVNLTFIERDLKRRKRNGEDAELLKRLWQICIGETDPLDETQPAPQAPTEDPAPARRRIELADRIVLDAPASLLHPLMEEMPARTDLDNVQLVQMWALVGLSALARREREDRLELSVSAASNGGRFAGAVGLEDLIHDRPVLDPGERGRTYKLHRVKNIREVESAASKVSRLMLPGSDDDELRRSIYYVLVELIRNAIQHSEDASGGVVGAQLMEGDHYPQPAVQVAVADAGIGIQAALARSHAVEADPETAVTKALEPHISGTFAEGLTGSKYNAGMGLFFISEMAKLTGGRLVIATRGATLSLRGDPEGLGHNDQRFVQPRGLGFPGTLVAFELPLDGVGDHDALLDTIRERAAQRTPGRDVKGWLRFGDMPENTLQILVRHVAEDTVEGERLAKETIQPKIVSREPVALDFRGVDTCTQSFLHSLLFESLRMAWALQVPIYIMGAEPAVVSGLRLVERYALAG